MPKVTVVGSGIAGASIFFALARRGAEVTLVDDGAVGQSTAASAGIIEPWSSQTSGAYYKLYTAGAGYYPQLLAQLAKAGITKTDYLRSGALIVHRDPEKLEAEYQRLESRRAEYGASMEAMGRVERISNKRARELFPPLAQDLHALFIEGGGRVDGRTLRDALLDGGQRLGGILEHGAAALRGDTSVEVDGQIVESDAVVIAAGAWSHEVLKQLGVETPVEPQRGQITHLRLEGVDTSQWPTVYPLSHHYLVAFDDGRIAVGATRENGVGFDPRVTAQGQLQILQDGFSIAPGLAEATLIETRVGLRPVVNDGVPIVGAVPGHEGLFVATGYAAGGLTMGPMLGDLLARKILGESVPELDIAAPRVLDNNE